MRRGQVPPRLLPLSHAPHHCLAWLPGGCYPPAAIGLGGWVRPLGLLGADDAWLLVPGRLIKRLRALRHRWSPARDRAFHDALFAAQSFDPFTFAYPGYVTIRRFADLASPYLEGKRSALDVGCGPAEITCELARRHPTVRFLGIDHSEAAIRRAREHGQALALPNVAFAVADVERFQPHEPIDVVMLFNSFHHLLDPAGFVERMGRHASAFLLIEPRGDWAGNWRRDLDFDWVLSELEKIRARVAYLVREDQVVATTPPSCGAGRSAGEPIEQRYTLAELQRFLAGYSLELRGTVAGFESCPPYPGRHTPTREWFGRLAYELVTQIDAALAERELDLLAKHWLIYAERGAPAVPRRPPRSYPPPDPLPALEVQGPYDVEYLGYDGPRVAGAGEAFRATLHLRNRSWREWSSAVAEHPVHVSYHWLGRRRRIEVFDGERSRLPRPLAPGEEGRVMVRLVAPSRPGWYVLAIDLVHEGVTWFSDAGSPWLEIPFRVAAS